MYLLYCFYTGRKKLLFPRDSKDSFEWRSGVMVPISWWGSGGKRLSLKRFFVDEGNASKKKINQSIKVFWFLGTEKRGRCCISGIPEPHHRPTPPSAFWNFRWHNEHDSPCLPPPKKSHQVVCQVKQKQKEPLFCFNREKEQSHFFFLLESSTEHPFFFVAWLGRFHFIWKKPPQKMPHFFPSEFLIYLFLYTKPFSFFHISISLRCAFYFATEENAIFNWNRGRKMLFFWFQFNFGDDRVPGLHLGRLLRSKGLAEVCTLQVLS